MELRCKNVSSERSYPTNSKRSAIEHGADGMISGLDLACHMLQFCKAYSILLNLDGNKDAPTADSFASKLSLLSSEDRERSDFPCPMAGDTSLLLNYSFKSYNMLYAYLVF